MKDVFKYTFTAISEVKKFLIVVMVVSIFTLFEPYPFIGMILIIFEKILYFSIGAFFIHLVIKSNDIDSFYSNLKNNSIATMFFHFLPTAMGILLALILIMSFWILFFTIILSFTGTLWVMANPHNFISNIAKVDFVTSILIGFYLVYLLFFSYIFLGKLGESLSKNSFKASFISIVLSLFDFKFWIKTFNFRYFLIYTIWSIFILTVYSILSFAYVFVIYPQIISNPNISLIAIPLLVAMTTITTYFTFFSGYFAYKAINNS